MTAATTTTSPAAVRDGIDPDDHIVQCVRLSKVFKDFWLRDRVRAVDNIDIDIRRGEVFGLLGPNGSGKSTTIKMILGLLHPSAGRIAVFGKRPDNVGIKEKIGYLPEESYLYPFLNARETLDYYGRLFHQNQRQRQRRIDMLLEMVGLEAVQRRPIREYSKGMQRRIGLAQALINDPQLLILDEPTTGMDPIGTKQIKDLILELARPRNGKPGKTILLSSHLLADVEDVCDRVTIMFGGKIRAAGTLDDLLTQEDRTTLETTTIDDATIQEIEQVLERRGKAIQKVDHPRQRLDNLFLDIVHKAQAEGASTHGATSGGRIADFLVRDAHLPEDVDPSAVIDQLVGSADEVRTPPDAAKAQSQEAPAIQAEEKGEDADVIAALSQPAEPKRAAPSTASQPKPTAPPPESTRASDTSKSDEEDEPDESVLRGLIGSEEKK